MTAIHSVLEDAHLEEVAGVEGPLALGDFAQVVLDDHALDLAAAVSFAMN